MLPAFVSVFDLAARVPRGVSDDDAPRAQAALDDASALIRAETRKAWVDDVGDLALPTGADEWKADILRSVCCKVAQRAFVNPDGVTSEQLGAYQESLASASPDVYLTSTERRELTKVLNRVGIWAQPVTRGPLETERWPRTRTGVPVEAAFVEVVGGDSIPWIDPPDIDTYGQ